MDKFTVNFDLAVGINILWSKSFGSPDDDLAAPIIFSARLWIDHGFGDLREISVLWVLPAGRLLTGDDDDVIRARWFS